MMNKDKELQERYGHLLDKYLDANVCKMEIMEQCEEKNARYSDWLEKGKAASDKRWDEMMKAAEAANQSRLQREAVEEQSRIRMMKRIERKAREEQERINRNAAFVDEIFARKREREEAEADRIKKEREEAESRQRYLDSVQALVNMNEETAAISARAKKIIERNDKNRKAHEEKMKWYEKEETCDYGK